jgi:hypothetical protein
MPKPKPSTQRADPVGVLPAPWNAALAATVKLGVPAVIALGLVWLIAWRQDTKVDQIQASLSALISLQQRTLATLGQINASSQRSCLLIAKTDQDRIACVLISEVK